MNSLSSLEQTSLNLERPLSLAMTVARAIEEAIALGELPPGSPIVESRLREKLNVSRSTLREALRLLQDRGLVEVVTHRGAVVTTLSARKAKEIFSLRMLLEPYALRLGMEGGRFTESVLQDMYAKLRRLYDLADAGNRLALVEADMDFHRTLCGQCDHEMLLQMLDSLHLHTRRFILFTKLYQTDLKTEAETHQPIWDALQSGDIALSETVLREHIQEAGELLIQKALALETPGSEG